MTPKQKAYRNNLLSTIHLSTLYKTVYAHDRELWESFLTNAYGVSSSSKLFISELANLAAYLNGKVSVLIADPKRKANEEGKATQAQISKIETVWAIKARDKSEMALRNFINRIVKSRPLYLYNLNRNEATKVILALENLAVGGAA